MRVHSNVAIEHMPAPYGRGVVARSRVPAGKPLVSVPRSSLLTLQSLVGHPVEPIMAHAAEMDVREDDLLAIMLLYEKHIAVRFAALLRFAARAHRRTPRCPLPPHTGRRFPLVTAHCAAAGVVRHSALLQPG